MKLTIAVLNFRDTQVTINCLHSLAPCSFWQSKEAKVVIWENTTGPEPIALLQACVEKNKWQDWVELKPSSANLGFTGGNNRIIEAGLKEQSQPDYFLLLNSDTLVTEQAIRSLHDFMDAHPDVGIAGSQLLSASGEIQASPFRFPSIASEFDNGLRLGIISRLLSRWNVVMPTPDQPCPVDWLSGASMLLRRSMLEQIGLLDEDFFTYYEDVDLCRRAHQAGWGVWYVPDSKVIHFEGASSEIVRHVIKRRPAYWFQARRRYYLKHHGTLNTALIDAAFITGFSLWRIRRLIQNKPDDDPPQMLIDFIRHSVFCQGFQIPKVQLDATMQQANNDRFDIMYVEGPGDLVDSFRRWQNQEDVLSETARTYSGQFFDFCSQKKLKTVAISYHDDAKSEITPQFHVENIPKKSLGGGLRYHLSQILYGLKLVALAIKYRPRYLDVTSGVTYWFVLSPLKLFGINIVAHMHNCLWPVGFPPTSLIRRLLLKSDGWFFRHIATASLCVSPEIQRQIEEIAKKTHGPIYQFRGQFNRKDFTNPPKPVPHGQKPFTIVFAGRIERNKGVFDLLDMAEQLKNDKVNFIICGGGSALEELKKDCQQRGLADIVRITDSLKRPELLTEYAKAHIVIVPTRSDFDEGFAKVAAEAILLNRPAICSSVVPAVEVLKNAVVAVKAEDTIAYITVIRQLLSDKSYYDDLCHSCFPLREQFLDNTQSLFAALQKSIIVNSPLN